MVCYPLILEIQIMAQINKLSVEKAVKKIISDDETESRSVRRDREMDALDDEIRRMKGQRHRLERRQRKPE